MEQIATTAPLTAPKLALASQAQFDEITLIRSILGKLKKLDYATTSRVLIYMVNWNESRQSN